MLTKSSALLQCRHTLCWIPSRFALYLLLQRSVSVLVALLRRPAAATTPVPSVRVTSRSSFVESLLVRRFLDSVGVLFVLPCAG